MIDYEDFMNKYGGECVVNFLRENENFNTALNDPLNLNSEDKKVFDYENAINKVTGRVALLATEKQEEFYDTLAEMYRNFVDFKIQEGTYDLEMETQDLQAETLKKQPTISAKGTGKSVFSAPTFEEVCWINVLKKPFTRKELEERLKEARKSNNEIAADYKNSLLEAFARRETIVNDKWERALDKLSAKYTAGNMSDVEYSEGKKLNTESKAKEIQHEREKLNNQYSQIEPLIQAFTVGSAWNFAWGDRQDMTLPCVCLGVSINEKSKNPYAPSNMFVEFAVSDSTRFFKLNFADQQRMALMAIKQAPRWKFKDDLLEKWEYYTAERSANREKRVLVTGNILQAFGSEKYANGGKLVSFTRKGGTIDKGILLRADVSQKLCETNTKIEATLTVPMAKAKQHILVAAKNQQTFAEFHCSGSFDIIRNYSSYTQCYTYSILTKSKSVSEYSFLLKNARLIELSKYARGFATNRGSWWAEFTQENMPAVIDELHDFEITVQITGIAAEQMQEELSKESKQNGGNWKKLSWNEQNIPKSNKTNQKQQSDTNTELELLQLRAKAIKIKLRLENEQ
ncbi:MAG: hypothetical protein LBU90_07585 [Bacteroidales bacterium]|nr:hypothetical protein [Bacteroidales bacterium]